MPAKGVAAVRWIAERAAYPIILASAVLGYAAAVAAGADAWPAAYAVVALAYVCILLHETLLPERRDWRPRGSELVTDLVYLALVQVLLPQLLSLAAVLILAEFVAGHGWSIGGLWPHDWSPWAQLVLLTVMAELPRYWLHRLSHNVDLLWRFHAVHHAPNILYSVNVGRFHPVDKALQFVVEVLPFIVVGVAPEVLSLYFVFYAVTGFYQHANCRVRLGPLNWIIAGPELHRWHHSVRLREANSNYGNKLIVWDALFGTRFLPKGRHVAALGIADRSYPTSFVAQLSAPFARRRSRS